MGKRGIVSRAVFVTLSTPWIAIEAAPPAPVSHVPEIVGTLQDWNLGAGYVVVNGVRYRTSENATVSGVNGSERGDAIVLKRGLKAGLVTVDGNVTSIVIFPEE